MRVLHVTRDFPPRINGGISVAVGTLVREQRTLGIDTRVVSFDAWRPSRGAPPETMRPCEVAEDPHLGWVARLGSDADPDDAARGAARWRPDVVHVHHDMLWGFGASIAQASDATTCLTVHVLHAATDALRGVEAPTMSRVAQERALSEADAIIAPCDDVADRLRRGGLSGARVWTVPHGVAVPRDDLDRAAISIGAERSCPRTTELGSSVASGATVASSAFYDHARTYTVLYAGRFSDIKGTGDWLDAIPRVASRFPDTRFEIAGGNPDSPKRDRRWRRRWEAAALALEPSDADRGVHLLGWLAGGALRDAIVRADIVVVPSWYETFGLAAAESMALGRCVVATRVGGLRALIVDEQSGLLTDPQSPGALATRVCDALEGTSHDRTTWGANAARRIATHFDPVCAAQRTLNVYRCATKSV